MTIYVDADACPVKQIVERIAEQYGIPLIFLCDTSHTLSPAYGEVRVIGEGADAVDLALINLCHAGDIVVSQDYGVAALALGKKCYCIHQSGRWYTDDNIDTLLMEPAKRTEEDDLRFAASFERMVRTALGQSD